MKATAFIICLIAAFGFLVAPAAHAHRVSIFAWVDGDTVHTESKFGRRPGWSRAAWVRVFDLEGNLLLEGKTDDNGEFSFQVPKRVAPQARTGGRYGTQERMDHRRGGIGRGPTGATRRSQRAMRKPKASLRKLFPLPRTPFRLRPPLAGSPGKRWSKSWNRLWKRRWTRS